MRDLIDRLEKATGPSVSLNRAIWCALNPGQDPTTYNGDPRWKPYTASIDAALTLKPDGCCADTQERQLDSRTFYRSEKSWARIEAVGGQVFLGAAIASTVPLALCAAALKAHAMLAEDQTSGAK